MNREQAEKLLAALIFDDLDEPSKSELLAYLQTDDELRDRLADMRMAAKLACDAVNEGPAPALNERRLEQLRRLAKADKAKVHIFTMKRLTAVAAVLIFGLVMAGLFMPSLSRVHKRSHGVVPAMVAKSPPAYELRSLSEREALAYSLQRKLGLRRQNDGSSPDSTEASSARGDSSGMMGGMGGYRGRGEGEVVNGAIADSDRYAIEMTGGESLPGQRVVASDKSTILAPPLATPMMRDEYSDQPDMKGKVIAGVTSLHENSDVVVMDDQGKAQPRQELDGDGMGRSGAVQTTPPPARPPDLGADVGGKSPGVVQYGWSGTVLSEKPGVTMTPPAGTGYAAPSDGKTNAGLGIAQSSEGRESAAALGDKLELIVSKLAQGESQVKKDLRGRDNVEIDKATEESTSMSTVQLDVVLSESNRTPREPAIQVSAEPNESPAAAASRFKVVPVNPWVMTDRDSMSTFALDVDTASYTLCRQYIRSGYLPPVGAVRMEEFINAFDYAYPQRDDATFAVHAEGAPSPFAREGQDVTLLKIGVKARTVGRDQRRAAHLIFVVDASASMGQAERLPVVQAALNLLVDKLDEVDRVSLVTCANEARLHLEAVPARQKDTIRQAIDAIQPAGPTNLMAGLELGYAMARRAFVAGRINQVVLCSDGVANVGQTEADAVLQEVAQDRKQGITLTCVGVGYGAYNDAFLEALADNGDGRYVFLDSSDEAREALVGQLAATLQTVAKDARIQVQFNPGRVRRYRLIGYENRDIEDQRFRDDTIDAGEVGSGQCSTALYELELTGHRVEGVPPSNRGLEARDTDDSDIGTVFVRYRNDETGQIEEISRALAGSVIRRRSVESDPRFFLAAGVARFAEWLRQSEHVQGMALADVQRVLDQVSAALPLDRDIQDVAALARQAEHLPRAQ